MNQHGVKNNKISYDIESKIEAFHWWFSGRRRLLRLFLASFNLPKNFLAIEVGCGTGANLRILRSMGLIGIGLDKSVYPLSLIKDKESYSLLAGDLNQLPFKPESVGVIIAMDILEHLGNDTQGIKESYQVLRKGGLLFLTVPAFKSLWGIQDNLSGHKRRYTKTEVVSKLIEAGYKILKVSYFNFFLFFPILLGRRMISLVGLKIKSENEINSPLLNFFLKIIFSIEPYLLKYLNLPFGVSIFCVAKKS